MTKPCQRPRVLVVEDDYLAATELAHALEDLGIEVLGPVGTVADALREAVSAPAIDAAVLDVNLRDEMVFPVADALARRGVPYTFATGYDAWVIPAAHANAPRFGKPVDPSAVARVLRELAAG